MVEAFLDPEYPPSLECPSLIALSGVVELPGLSPAGVAYWRETIQAQTSHHARGFVVGAAPGTFELFAGRHCRHRPWVFMPYAAIHIAALAAPLSLPVTIAMLATRCSALRIPVSDSTASSP